MKSIPNDVIQDIRKIQTVLQNIKDGKNCFYNIVQYKNLGLITMTKRYITTIAGNREWDGFHIKLTDKAEQYLKIVI